MKPNIVLIVTDDQPKGLLDAMPITRAEIRDKGVIYPTGIIPTPLCGPSRTTILTGVPSHDHGRWLNTGPSGQYSTLKMRDTHTIATAVQDAGYHTGLYGKYVNGWDAIVPPGWARFGAIQADDGGEGAYYDYSIVGTEPTAHYASVPEDYSTDVLAALARGFVLNAPVDRPLFLYFSPYGVHGNFTPAPRHEDTWPLEPVSPSFNSSNTFRAPWTRSLPLQDELKQQTVIRDQHETIMSVDDAVGGILTALGERAANTLFVFTGDNGLQRGDHRMTGKNLPYQGSTNVQMLMRWDGHIDPDSKVKEPVTQADLTATMIAAASAAALPGQFGVNVLAPFNRSGVYIEGMGETVNTPHPGFIGWRTRRYLYINWGTGQGEELYDYDQDPYELLNLAAAHTPPPIVATLRAKTLTAGHPYPPGFTPVLG